MELLANILIYMNLVGWFIFLIYVIYLYIDNKRIEKWLSKQRGGSCHWVIDNRPNK